MEIVLNEDVLKDNNTAAAFIRDQLRISATLSINLMSSPGAGKTTLLEATIAGLKDRCRIGVIEGDLATEKDANRIRALGVKAVQINTGGGCHLDARMVTKVLPEFDLEQLDILFIENVGNLVCPSGYDLGQHHKVAVLSIPEGNDKIPKYPTMFMRTELVLLNKVDLLPYVDFSVEDAVRDLHNMNPESMLLPLSARTREGMEQWLAWIEAKLQRSRRPAS
jgi:hydrogenase nickel incorporation protein HypB